MIDLLVPAHDEPPEACPSCWPPGVTATVCAVAQLVVNVGVAGLLATAALSLARAESGGGYVGGG